MKILSIQIFKILGPVFFGLLFVLISMPSFSNENSSEVSGPCEYCKDTTISYAKPLEATFPWDLVKNAQLGNCLLPPNYVDIMREWKRFQTIASIKTRVNAKRIPKEMRVSSATKNYMRDLKAIEPLVSDLAVIKESPWFKNLYQPKGQIDKNFLKYARSDAFLNNFAENNFTDPHGPNQDTNFRKGYDSSEGTKDFVPGFKGAVDRLQIELRRPQVREVLAELDKKRGISVFDPVQMGQYQEFMKFFKDRNATSQGIQELFSENARRPLQSEIALPKISIETNLFQKGYLKTVDQNIDDFIWHTPLDAELLSTHLNESVSSGEKLGEALDKIAEQKNNTGPVSSGIETRLTTFNSTGAPSKFNLFDEKVATQFYSKVRETDLLNKSDDTKPAQLAPGIQKLNVLYRGQTIQMDAAKLSQVDMVARTLVGEVMDCQAKGVAQAEAVGIVIAQRMQSINAAAKEQADVAAKNETINAKNVAVSNSEDANADFLKSEDARLLGRRDFGRPPPPFPTSLPFMPAAEVVSRKLQFSVWNPNLAKTYTTANLANNPNIPDYKYPIFGPVSGHAIIDQTRALCPEIPKNSEKGSKANVEGVKLWPGDFAKSQPIWDHFTDLALEIVQDPQAYLKRYTWKPSPSQNDHIYFYTHGPNLPFARKIDVTAIHDNVTNKDLPLRYGQSSGKNADPCNSFRAFAPKDVGMYENKIH